MTWQNSDVKKKVNILSRPVNCNTYYSENSYLWLLKPTGLNRGRGIEIFNTLEQLYDKLQEYLALVDRRKIREKLIVDPSVKYSLSLAPDKLSLQPSNEKNQENDKSQ